MENEQICVLEFNQRFNCAWHDSPILLSAKERARALALIHEEVHEVVEAALMNDIVALAKELADVIYVVKGMAVGYGIDLEPVFKEVHRSNMTKIGGVKNEWGKILKPPGYTPAEIRPILEAQMPLEIPLPMPVSSNESQRTI